MMFYQHLKQKHNTLLAPPARLVGRAWLRKRKVGTRLFRLPSATLLVGGYRLVAGPMRSETGCMGRVVLARIGPSGHLRQVE